MLKKRYYLLSFLAFAFVVALLGTWPSGFTGTAFAEYGVRAKTAGCIANQALPDSDCSPGAVLTIDPSVVCVRGYTKTVRNVPTSVKRQVFAEYGIPYAYRSRYEVDHLISLEIGGSNDISNLWPEPYNLKLGAREKDKFENQLHALVCKGKMTLPEAQAEIATNWLGYYHKTITTPALTPVTPPTISATNTDTTTYNAPPTTSTTTPPPAPVPPPAPAPIITPTIPTGATAKCVDGTYSYSQTHSGTCSHHGGVSVWYR